MTMLTLLPLPTSLRPHERNAVSVELYAIARDAGLETPQDEQELAARVKRGLEVQARIRNPAVPRSRALVLVK